MSGNPVRDLHDAVARSHDPVIASTRPVTTTEWEMRRMVADVIAKLRPDGKSVVELGCGTGVLAVPISQRASMFTGIDMAGEAIEVLRGRLPNARLQCADLTRDDVSYLGTFDRVLVYAALHYVTTEAEGERFVQSALALLKPAGLALIGNLPLPSSELPHSPIRRAIGLVWGVLRRLTHPPRRSAPSPLPAGYVLPLTRPLIESWLLSISGIHWRWVAPRVGVPMHRTRADLLVARDGSAERG
ncbi:MAG: class I SAM-dependent methyltransferase [Solirubrobacteraceae bacterium]